MAEGSVRFSIHKLSNDNYSIWSYKMELMLIYENLWDVITGDQPAETETTKFATWKKSNDKARARIGLLVEDDQLLHIRNAKTAKENWNSLKDYHQKATLTSKVLLLKRLCRTTLEEDGDIFSNRLNQLSALGQDLPDNLTAVSQNRTIFLSQLSKVDLRQKLLRHLLKVNLLINMKVAKRQRI